MSNPKRLFSLDDDADDCFDETNNQYEPEEYDVWAHIPNEVVHMWREEKPESTSPEDWIMTRLQKAYYIQNKLTDYDMGEMFDRLFLHLPEKGKVIDLFNKLRPNEPKFYVVENEVLMPYGGCKKYETVASQDPSNSWFWNQKDSVAKRIISHFESNQKSSDNQEFNSVLLKNACFLWMTTLSQDIAIPRARHFAQIHHHSSSEADGWCSYWEGKENHPEPARFNEGEIINWAKRHYPDLLRQIRAEYYSDNKPKEEEPILEKNDSDIEDASRINSLTEIMGMNIPKREFIVENIIPRNSVVLIYGYGGKGKSWVSLELALSISSGKKAFGKYIVQPTKTLYMDKENGLQRAYGRIQRVCKGSEIEPNNLFFYKLDPNFKLDSEYLQSDDAREFYNFIEENDIEVIIFDSTRDFLAGDENSSKDVDTFFEYVKLLRKNKHTPILLHHTRKPNQQGKYATSDYDIRGSGNFSQQVDTTIQVDKIHPKKHIFQLKFGEKQRDNNTMYGFEFEIEDLEVKNEDGEAIYDPECPINIKFLRELGEQEVQTLSSVFIAEELVRKWCKDNNRTHFRTADANILLKDVCKRTLVSRVLKNLRENGFLENPSKGKWVVAQNDDQNNVQSYNNND